MTQVQATTQKELTPEAAFKEVKETLRGTSSEDVARTLNTIKNNLPELQKFQAELSTAEKHLKETDPKSEWIDTIQTAARGTKMYISTLTATKDTAGFASMILPEGFPTSPRSAMGK